ncbi:MAG: SDR family oxidoreductase, partial [Anaerolineales bacterium]|nr:SDR family oxidoreductase [Anaerolineales bacterium]
SDGSWARYPVYENVEPARLIAGVDALNFASVTRAFAQVKPDVVINCIGIIKQLKQAHDPLFSIALNALFPHQLADLCAATGARLFHISTDCVFSGRKGNYTETDISDAYDLYGRTKFLGEVDRPGCLTIRTSIIGRDFAKNDALLEWFLAHRGGKVQGYTRAIYTGFPTQTLARIMGELIEKHPNLSGLYQVASAPISKYELLVKLRAAMKLNLTIEPQSEFFCDRSLSAARFVAATGCVIPTWDEMVAEIANDPTPYDEWKNRQVASSK